jgi:hypothetical protein
MRPSVFYSFTLAVFSLTLLARAQSVNGSSGNFPFPQNRDNPYGYHSSIYNNADILAAYNKWYADCVTSAGAAGNLRVQRPNEPGLNPNSTVSEGIGYGMVIAVYMNDENLFDNLWRYEQSHLDTNGLMNWYIDASGATDGANGATDADEDMAWALLMASKQWGGNGTLGSSYQSLAVSQINRIYSTEISGGNPIGGDSFTNINPSYFSPAYYREFAAATGQTGWLTAAANSYTILNNNLSQGYGNVNNGLDSAWCTSAGVSTDTNNPPYDYQYDACRTPFRITEDYLWFGNASALSYATKTSNFFSAIGAVSIVDGYHLDGTTDSQAPVLPVSPSPVSQSAAFVGPAGVGGMVSHSYQSYVDNSYSDLAGSKLLQGGFYYDESWTVMSLLMLSDNFLDYNLYGSPTPTPTLSAYAPLTIRVNAGGPSFTDSAGATWFADQQFGGANTWGYDSATTGSTSTYAGQSIANTVNNQQTLYQTERWGNPLYRFTVPNGYYQVTFKFCENYDPDSHIGGRVFSVVAAGLPVITNLDVYQAAGGEHIAYDVPTTVVVTAGQLDVVFSSSADTSQVNAMQVLRLTSPPTATVTPTKTVTSTNTPLPPTPTATSTSGSPISTSTKTPTATTTLTPTNSATASPTFTPTATPTASSTQTPTATMSSTPTATPTSSMTSSGTATPSLTATDSPTPSFTASSSPTGTSTSTALFTATSSMTPTASLTASRTATQTATLTSSSTSTPSGTPTASLTSTPTRTGTSTPSSTSTATLTASVTPTPTESPSPTLTPTGTVTPFPTGTPSSTATATSSRTNSPTATATPSPTPTRTRTLTPSTTATPTSTRSLTPTATASPSPTSSLTPTATGTFTALATTSYTPTPSATFFPTPVLYPNPVYEGDQVQIQPPLTASTDVRVEIFTIAFRKVQDEIFHQTAVGAILPIQLTDKWNSPLANGLYYLAVSTPRGKWTMKLLILH